MIDKLKEKLGYTPSSHDEHLEALTCVMAELQIIANKLKNRLNEYEHSIDSIIALVQDKSLSYTNEQKGDLAHEMAICQGKCMMIDETLKLIVEGIGNCHPSVHIVTIKEED